MKIERIHEMALDADTAAQIGRLLDLAFGGGFGPRGHFLLRHHMRLIVRHGDAVTAHLALGLRAMRLGDGLIDVATIAEVATDPGWRGQGIATALVSAAVATARGTAASFALLFGDAGLYRAAGFRRVANRLRRVDMSGRVTRAAVDDPAGDLMMLPLGGTTWNESVPLDLLGPKF